MEKIQIMANNPSKTTEYPKNIVINNFNTPNALDDFDINVFDLNDADMWKNKSTCEREPNVETIMSADFRSINKMIVNSEKTINIICLPQNINYCWKCYSESYNRQLKDMIPLLSQILKQLIPIDGLEITYENSITLINENEIGASFFINYKDFDVLTRSTKSNKTTTIKRDRIIITSLDIVKKGYDVLLDFLYEIGILKKEEEYPEWVYQYSFNDDEIQKNNIEQAKEQIKIQKEIIENSSKKLQNNLRFKSILYNNSDQLVDVVFEILEFIFDISLSEFNDEKEEDFLFKKDNVTYIGEIKGVTSNVKYENISQLEVHYFKYLDKLQEAGATEQIKKILIINYERTKDVMIRDDINQMQIDLAVKNDTLIIDSKTLLTIYDRLLQKKVTKSVVIDYIKNSSGIIDLSKIK